MQKRVLITGGTGLLGSKITKKLLENKCTVAYLSTRRNYRKKGVDVFYWNPEEGELDSQALKAVDVIIHLAGAGIADKPWTKKRKLEILESRVQSTKLLIKTLKESDNQVKQLIGASAIGYYGDSSNLLDEASSGGSDFLAEVCKQWEAAYALEEKEVSKSIFRIGIVMAEDGEH
ncbi:MAG: NAD-dependent epimerase/dehydratase family protein [Chitinophagales bacterium]